MRCFNRKFSSLMSLSFSKAVSRWLRSACGNRRDRPASQTHGQSSAVQRRAALLREGMQRHETETHQWIDKSTIAEDQTCRPLSLAAFSKGDLQAKQIEELAGVGRNCTSEFSAETDLPSKQVDFSSTWCLGVDGCNWCCVRVPIAISGPSVRTRSPAWTCIVKAKAQWQVGVFTIHWECGGLRFSCRKRKRASAYQMPSFELMPTTPTVFRHGGFPAACTRVGAE